MARILMKGNEAMAEAAIQAGCQAFFGYPITPQSEIPEYFARELPPRGGLFLQAESEMAAMNMVMGASAAGGRVMTSTSGPGYCLKLEALAAMALTRLPAVVVVVMRSGPAFGTMKAAQELYEGIDIQGMGATGLITYMRTDSLRLSEDAIRDAREYIGSRWGEKYLPKEARHFKSRANAQDGHEAIRPTMVGLAPDQVKDSLTNDQYKLYKLIWERFLACQMAQCLQSTTQADITGNGYVFKASGYTVTFDGFTVLYVEGRDEAQEDEGALPPLEKDMTVRAKEIVPNQHFTQPPPRYTEASLIKAMEEYGIGRPSTYAATITTITGREYVVRDGKALKPTELGEVTTKLMKERFPKIVNVKFTAQMEEDLDGIEAGKENWVDTLEEFYGDFDKTLQKAKEEMKDVKITLEEDKTDLICEKCGRQMVVKVGRYGKFIACPGYPECKNIKKFVKETGAECPKCGGRVIEKKTKKGRVFYGCDHYPECDFVSWDEPIQEKCPKCGKTLLKKKGKKPKIYCVTEGCGYERVEDQNEN